MATYNNIADCFIAFSNCTGNLISNLKLQKLVYYVQAWHLAAFNEAVFEEDFQAWIHGPVLVPLYEQYKSYQWRPIVREDLTEHSIMHLKSLFSENLNIIMDDVVDAYFPMEAYALEQSTHAEMPWREARKGLPADSICSNVIAKEWMKAYYAPFVIA